MLRPVMYKHYPSHSAYIDSYYPISYTPLRKENHDYITKIAHYDWKEVENLPYTIEENRDYLTSTGLVLHWLPDDSCYEFHQFSDSDIDIAMGADFRYIAEDVIQAHFPLFKLRLISRGESTFRIMASQWQRFGKIDIYLTMGHCSAIIILALLNWPIRPEKIREDFCYPHHV